MQSDIMMSNLLEKEYSIEVRTAVPGFLDNFIPNDTEGALEFGKSIAYVKFEANAQRQRQRDWRGA